MKLEHEQDDIDLIIKDFLYKVGGKVGFCSISVIVPNKEVVKRRSRPFKLIE
jgi:hypothetical protein